MNFNFLTRASSLLCCFYIVISKFLDFHPQLLETPLKHPKVGYSKDTTMYNVRVRDTDIWNHAIYGIKLSSSVPEIGIS
jgi:hypothetical protein